MRPASAKAKGRLRENYIAERLRDHGFMHAQREGKGAESLDVIGTPYNVEVKHVKTWQTFKWIRKQRKVSAERNMPWVLFAAHGDMKTAEGAAVGAVMIVDEDHGLELLQMEQQHDLMQGWLEVQQSAVGVRGPLAIEAMDRIASICETWAINDDIEAHMEEEE